mmetsp:Transcript_22018/g.61934  ORF Transcript_22018/g.61934 Transcript_22018/m.61934 type:complete len:238 (-) Transcript_22018:258-971(-)
MARPPRRRRRSRSIYGTSIHQRSSTRRRQRRSRRSPFRTRTARRPVDFWALASYTTRWLILSARAWPSCSDPAVASRRRRCARANAMRASVARRARSSSTVTSGPTAGQTTSSRDRRFATCSPTLRSSSLAPTTKLSISDLSTYSWSMRTTRTPARSPTRCAGRTASRRRASRSCTTRAAGAWAAPRRLRRCAASASTSSTSRRGATASRSPGRRARPAAPSSTSTVGAASTSSTRS